MTWNPFKRKKIEMPPFLNLYDRQWYLWWWFEDKWNLWKDCHTEEEAKKQRQHFRAIEIMKGVPTAITHYVKLDKIAELP